MTSAYAQKPLAAVLMAVLVLAGAGACRAVPAADAAIETERDTAELTGSAWKVTAMGAVAVVSGREPTLAFGPGGHLTGSGGCNRLFGDFTQDGAKLTVTALGATKMMCAPPALMAQERALFDRLSGVTELAFDEGAGTLTIVSESGAAFQAERIVAATGADPELLTGAAWIVEDINRGGVIDNSRLTLTFAADGRVSGSTNCNAFSGVYSADETTVTFAPLAITERACAAPAMAQQEQRYMAALSGERTWKLTTTGALELTGPAGQRLLLRR